jgi:hypothetical protein
MAMRSLIPLVQELSPAALTVIAQTISPNDSGRLRWSTFFPRQNVDSVDLREVTTLNFRPTSDRREWNSRGRLIPDVTPPIRELSIVPVEGYYKWDEYEMQKMSERANANSAIIDEILGRSIPGKVAQIVEANYRRIEVDAFTAWATGTNVAMNPQTGSTHTVSYGFPGDRLTTAGTAWDDAGVNAYDLLISFIEDAIDKIGPVVGVVLRTALHRAIHADAPNGPAGVIIPRGRMAEQVSDDLGIPFNFFLFDDTLDVFTDGGITTATANVWPAGYIAAVPAGGVVGRTAFAPVVRAMEMVRALPGAGIDQRGQTVYYDESVLGRDLTVECQVNPFTIPNEQKLRVENTLVV